MWISSSAELSPLFQRATSKHKLTHSLVCPFKVCFEWHYELITGKKCARLSAKRRESIKKNTVSGLKHARKLKIQLLMWLLLFGRLIFERFLDIYIQLTHMELTHSLFLLLLCVTVAYKPHSWSHELRITMRNAWTHREFLPFDRNIHSYRVVRTHRDVEKRLFCLRLYRLSSYFIWSENFISYGQETKISSQVNKK